MIHNEPLPLLEAFLFLTNRAAGVSCTSFLKTTFGDTGPQSDKFSTDFQILVELERRLNASVAIPEKILEKLFVPLQHQEKKHQQPSSPYLASLLWANTIEAFVDWEESRFFDLLQKQLPQVPQRILKTLGDNSWNFPGEIEVKELFAKVNDSQLPQSVKLALIDLALNSKQYALWLQQALTPVAAEFRNSRELIEPLLEQFQSRNKSRQAAFMVKELCRMDLNGISRLMVYPTVVCSHYAIAELSPDCTQLLCCVGTLFDLLRETLAAAQNSGARLSMTLDVLSNRNRFQILTRLLEGPAYGRELAKAVGVTPGAISQHIGALQSINLVTVHTDGRRVYYSFNAEGIDRFIAAFKAYFKRP